MSGADDDAKAKRACVGECAGSVFPTRVADACLRLMIAYMSVETWFTLSIVSRTAKAWTTRTCDVFVATTLSQRVRHALEAELRPLGIHDYSAFQVALRTTIGLWSGSGLLKALLGSRLQSARVAHTVPIAPMLAAPTTTFPASVAPVPTIGDSSSVALGGMLAKGELERVGGGGGDSGSAAEENVAAAKARTQQWDGRDLDFFVPLQSENDLTRLCPLAAFFDDYCERDSLDRAHPAVAALGAVALGSRCYTTTEAVRDSTRVAVLAHDTRSAYYEWNAVPRTHTNMDGSRGPQVATKRNWLWRTFAHDGCRVPGIVARRTFGFSSGQQVHIVYVDLAQVAAAAAGTVAAASPPPPPPPPPCYMVPLPPPPVVRERVCFRPSGVWSPTPPTTLRAWIDQSLDVSILKNSFDGTRLVSCAYACLQSRSFDICEVPPIFRFYERVERARWLDSLASSNRSARSCYATAFLRVTKFTRRGLTARGLYCDCSTAGTRYWPASHLSAPPGADSYCRSNAAFVSARNTIVGTQKIVQREMSGL